MLPDLSALQHFHFLRPEWVLLLVFWFLISLMQKRRSDSRDMFGGIIAPHLLEHLRVGRFNRRWFTPRSVNVVIVAMLTLVLMGPTWRQQPSPLSQDEAALVLMLDISSSMQQRDIQPSRLQRSKQKIGDLLALRPDKKAALVVYAGTAHTVLTLTADQDILGQYLAAIRPEIMPRAGKFPEYGLPQVDQILRETNAPATIVLFTDGLGADSRSRFRDYFDSRPHQLIVVGVGTQETGDGMVPMERAALQGLADAAGGQFLTLSVDDGDVRKINRRVNSHYVIVQDSALPWLDSGYPLVFPAMLLFLLWFRKGWTLTWGWLLLPLVFAADPPRVHAQGETTESAAEQEEAASGGLGQWFADLWLSGDQQGRLLLQLGDYRAAAAQFDDPMWKGLAYYYAEDFMLAAEYFSRSDSDAALFNEANARAHARDYLRAVHRYDRLLRRRPDYPGAAQNRERVQQLIEEINRLSESQQQEAGVSGEDKELGGDDAIPAQGADEISWEKAEISQLSAEDILQDPATADMWLRGVQQDPSNFLAIKFSMQLQREEDSGPQGAAP